VTEKNGTEESGPLRTDEAGGFEILDVLVLVGKHKKFVAAVSLGAGLLAALITLLMPNIYIATARVLPPQQSQSTAAALLGQLAGIAPAGSIPGLKNPGDLYVGMLKSRTVADRLIERFGLKEYFEQDTLLETRLALARVTSISAGKDGIISIDVEDELPARAAALANAYVEELEVLNGSLALTEASQRRLFFEKQLKQAKDALASSEVELKKTQEQTGLIKLDDQGRAIIEAVAALRAQVVGKEVQIGAMKSFATESNPDLARAQRELSGLQAQLRKMERDKLSGDGDILVPTGRVPEAGLEYIRKFRDVKYNETLFELVAKQYELARLDEAKDASLIQVVDKAVEPDKKARPKRALICAIVTILAGFLALLWVYQREAHAQGGPDRLRRVALLKRYWSFRRLRAP
jgi:tyrosine-protein kinase Etk/Wzc